MKLVRHLSLAAVVVFSACEVNPGLTKVSPAAGTATQEIQGGTRDTTSSNVVAIIINTAAGIGICSGSLIAPNLVLTAHHCVADSNTTACTSTGFGTPFAANSFRITPNATAAGGVFSSGQVPAVDNSTWFTGAAVSLPTSPNNNICGGDMALIRLSTNITTICPLIPRVDSAVTLNEAYTAIGFGVTSPSGQGAGTRYSLPGVVNCANNCGQGTNATLEWNGANATGGVCEGDSGGPALDSQRRVLGTVSRGSGVCGDALYESVFGQGAWIKSVAAAAATAGGYPAAAWVTGGSTSINSCTGFDGGTGGGAGGGGGATGGGGGTTGGGGGTTGGGGGTTGTCNAGTSCIDASGMGDFTCLDPSTMTGVPANAPACSQTVGCALGFSCWQTGASSFACLQDCTGVAPVGGGAGGGVPTGGGAGGGVGGGIGGGGGTGGACTNAATSCVDASGQGNFACVDVNSSTGIPAGAPSCSQTTPCPANYGCWGTASGNFCLQNCTPGGTGGGAGGGGGAPVGGGSGGGVPVGGGAGGGTPVGGGAGGGTPVGGGAGGGTFTGGGTGGGSFTGGGTGTGGGTSTGGSGGSAGAGGGFMFPGLPDKPKPTGCSCTEVPSGVIWLALSGLTLIRRRRR